MKFWEWSTFSTGLLSALAADSSVTWCLILAFICMFSIVMINVSKGIEEEARKAQKIKNAAYSDDADSEWVRQIPSDKPLPSNTSTIWEEWQ